MLGPLRIRSRAPDKVLIGGDPEHKTQMFVFMAVFILLSPGNNSVGSASTGSTVHSDENMGRLESRLKGSYTNKHVKWDQRPMYTLGLGPGHLKRWKKAAMFF